MTATHFELKKVLQVKLAEMQLRNPQYSLRAFAKSLNIHAASLSEFFNDKRQFSPKMAKKIVEKLAISPEKKQELMNLLDRDHEGTVTVERVQLDTDSYYLVADPIYYSLLCLIETKDFQEDLSWMSKRLKRPSEQISLAIERLLRVKLLIRDQNEQLVYNANAQLMTSDDVANASLRLRHSENLEAARDALVNLPVDKRYFNFETLPMGQESMAEAKKIINEARAKLVKLSGESTKDDVYEFCFNFFPRTFDTKQDNHINNKDYH